MERIHKPTVVRICENIRSLLDHGDVFSTALDATVTMIRKNKLCDSLLDEDGRGILRGIWQRHSLGIVDEDEDDEQNNALQYKKAPAGKKGIRAALNKMSIVPLLERYVAIGAGRNTRQVKLRDLTYADVLLVVEMHEKQAAGHEGSAAAYQKLANKMKRLNKTDKKVGDVFKNTDPEIQRLGHLR